MTVLAILILLAEVKKMGVLREISIVTEMSVLTVIAILINMEFYDLWQY